MAATRPQEEALRAFRRGDYSYLRGVPTVVVNALMRRGLIRLEPDSAYKPRYRITAKGRRMVDDGSRAAA
jgi:hypothetical protein